MTVDYVWEHNGNDTLIYAVDFVGAFSRGESLDVALKKLPAEIEAYARWRGIKTDAVTDCRMVGQWQNSLDVCDADSDVILDAERKPLSYEEYCELKALALKSAADVLKLYELVPDKNISNLPYKDTFLGPRPRTAWEMYKHTKDVNSYYFGEIGVDIDHDDTIYDCRLRGFEKTEQKTDFLDNKVLCGSFNEEWSLRKVIRRFVWHDRIHMKAMHRMCKVTFGENAVADIFCFDKYKKIL